MPPRPSAPSLRHAALVLAALVLTLGACTGGTPEAGTPEAEGWQLGPFDKYAANPILQPQGATWMSKDVFNPTVWTDGQTITMLFRAEDSTGIGQWNGTSTIGLAHSTDGLHFTIEPDPVLVPTEPYELPGGCEDPRLVRIGDTFYLTYTAYDGTLARLAMASSADLRTWEKHGLVFEDRGWTKSGAILAQPVDGQYWMYFGDTNIWAAHSDDLRTWEVVEEPVLRPRPGKFDSKLVEPGPPPILTEDGILLIYNGADDNTAYAVGQALFDPADPTRLLQRGDAPFFEPSHQLEQEGQVPNVVFVEGLARLGGTWFLYYGMGDSGIGVAQFRP